MSSKREQNIEEAYSRIKAIYKEKGVFHSFYTFYRHLTCPIKKIFTLIPEEKTILDIGCGFGFISLWTALVFRNSTVKGMDLVKERIDFASDLCKDIPNLSFEVKDITKDNLEENGNMILLIDLFHHVPFESQLPFLKQCMDRIPSGGYIIFKDIDRRPWWKYKVNYIQDYIFTKEKTFSRDRREYMKFFEEEGFETEYFDLMKFYPYSHYLIRARKK